MSLDIGAVTFDCHDATLLAGFYAALLGVPVDEGASEFFATVGRDPHPSGRAVPTLFFLAVPDKNPGKNVVHLDLLTTGALGPEVERAVALGATHVRDIEEAGFAWATLRDPEGNVFDIARHSASDEAPPE